MQPHTRTQLRALAMGALFLVFAGSCTQPTMNCTTAHLYYAAKYELTSGDPASPCGQVKGDVLGMQTYFGTGGINGTAKFDEPSAAIRSQRSGLLIAEAMNYGSELEDGPIPIPGFTDVKGFEHYANAEGAFEAGFPDDEGFCHVEKLGPAVVDRPELPEYMIPDDPATMDMDESETVPATPPISVSHEWTNARWVTTPDAQGTQFEADLKYTENDCTAEFHVVGVSPAVPCEKDADCTATGNGINPDFAVRCDTEIDGGLCVLARDLPSYE